MKHLTRALALITMALLPTLIMAQPTIEKHGDYAHIVANGQPMLMIGGELGNSSASVPADIKASLRRCAQLGLNTVLVPVTWCQLEPTEGEFDLSLVDCILDEATANDMKIVLLWFGAWKNSMSCYAPDWVKTDAARFPRAHVASGRPVEEASSLSDNVLEADKRAFCRMLEHLRDNDKDETVIMVQVENEIGMIESPRDYSDDATALYNSPVPAKLLDYLAENFDKLHPYMRERLKKGGKGKTWGEMFGNDIYAEEIFQTWTYALYVQKMIEAGRAVYDLPMYVNVALDSRGRLPGQYPSGGPLAQLIDVWHCGAPGVDVLGVDIYDKDFPGWLNRYHLYNNPLFIPEVRLEDRDAMYALYAFGHHDAMGFCPFSIEDYPVYASQDAADWSGIDLTADDQINVYGTTGRQLSPLAATFRLLRQAEPLILQRQGTEDMDAVLLDNTMRQAELVTPDSVRITVRHSLSLGWEPASRDSVWPEAACLIIRLAEMDYLAIGSDVVLTFTPAEGNGQVGILSCDEVEITNGKTTPIRHLNGDQTHQGRHVRIPHGQFAIQRFRLYTY